MLSYSLLHFSCDGVIFQDRDTFSLKLEDTENWLYEDGEDQSKQVYIDKLNELKVTVLWIRLVLKKRSLHFQH